MTTQAGANDTISIVQRSPQTALVRVIEGPVEDLPRLIGEAFAQTIAAIERADATVAGPPFARYLAFGARVRAEVGFPFEGRVVPERPLHAIVLPGGRVATTTHVGPYDAIGETWQRTTTWLTEHDLHRAGPPWEAYLTGPNDPGPPITEIVWPIE